MRRRVYRSLDRPTSVFGIRGRFLLVMALGGALALIVGMTVGRAAGMLAGTGTGLLLTVAAYVLTQSLQSRIEEKDLAKILVRRTYPTLYRVHLKHIRNIWKGFNIRTGRGDGR